MASVTSINNYSEFTVKQRKKLYRRVQFLTGRRPMGNFSPGAVATIALWKSAPMFTGLGPDLLGSTVFAPYNTIRVAI